MAAAFRPVNSPLASDLSRDDILPPSPATPRPNTAPQGHPSSSRPDNATTPTRATFNTAMASQKPLPSSPFPQAVQVPDQSAKSKMPRRENSRHSTKSTESVDVDMDDSDGEMDAVDEGAGSDDESVNADGSRSNKKKKSQRFYCVEYPPCNLSFTRSEHLARHIRKHTGERPFQCHCSRRFSRLDNLRQHAQTVHVNENIPIDSLAATGSRFPRAIRNDRARQAGNRARASTSGSAGGPVRGHSKSLSTSSITSIGSVGSTYSAQTDARRRPAPLVMADPRSRLSLESYHTADSTYSSYRAQSPSEFGTPTSTTFSPGQTSPRWASSTMSPTMSHSRTQSMYSTGTRTPGRRLSVPSGVNPFQSPQGIPIGRPIYGPGSMNASNSGVFSPANSSLVSSPTAPTSGWSRRESMSSNPDEAWRRRTWHPDSRPATGHPSQLSTVVSQSSVRPNPPPPMVNPSSQQSTLRLPGIESFDPVPHRPVTPPRRNPSPMMIDSEPVRSALQPPTMDGPPQDERRNLNLYDASLQRGLNRLDINHSTPPRDSAHAWASEVHRAVQAQAEQVRLNPPTVRFEDQQPQYQATQPAIASRAIHQHTVSAPSVATLRDNKRHGWYHGPVTVHRDPPLAPQQDPRANHVERMVHPNFNGFSGFPLKEQPPQQQEQQQQQQQQQQQEERPQNNDPLRRLEALVAVATSEGSTAAAY
ncbi:Fc.00g012440.m01.CDS01 [Cosmosporella sp. VM-42]